MTEGAVDTAMARAQAFLADDPEDTATKERQGRVEETGREIIEALRTVYDPEIPVNIYELGMVYGVEVEPPGKVTVKMTLTSPSCPVAGSLPGEVKARIESIPGLTEVRVDLVWDPPWEPSRMSEAARLELGMM